MFTVQPLSLNKLDSDYKRLTCFSFTMKFPGALQQCIYTAPVAYFDDPWEFWFEIIRIMKTDSTMLGRPIVHE